MWAQMIGFFLSFFANPSIWGIGLAVAFGAVWLVGYWPPLFKKPWLWAVLVTSALLTLAAISFVQIPLQSWAEQGFGYLWSQGNMVRWLLFTGITQVLIGGLVQEGAKLVPVAVYWWRAGKKLDPRLGLAVGAVAGMGFGVFEAQWAHNLVMASGWSWDWVNIYGIMALLGFGERFFAVAFHIAASALAGYGLAKGRGWAFYLIAAFLHAIVNYGAILWQSGVLTTIQVEIYFAVIAVLATGVALWLRWRKPEVVPKTEAVATESPANEVEVAQE